MPPLPNGLQPVSPDFGSEFIPRRPSRLNRPMRNKSRKKRCSKTRQSPTEFSEYQKKKRFATPLAYAMETWNGYKQMEATPAGIRSIRFPEFNRATRSPNFILHSERKPTRPANRIPGPGGRGRQDCGRRVKCQHNIVMYIAMFSRSQEAINEANTFTTNLMEAILLHGPLSAEPIPIERMGDVGFQLPFVVNQLNTEKAFISSTFEAFPFATNSSHSVASPDLGPRRRPRPIPPHIFGAAQGQAAFVDEAGEVAVEVGRAGGDAQTDGEAS